MTRVAAPLTRFDLPADGVARQPPEARGLARDEVRMLLAAPGRLEHHRVRDLPGLLHPGDLVVVNTSATVPASVPAWWRGTRTRVHVSGQLDDGHWVVELRRPDNSGPATPEVGDVLRLPGRLRLRLLSPYPDRAGQHRLWRAVPVPQEERVAYLAEHGRPVEYDYLAGEWPLEARQTVYAGEPGSAEMASAGRPLTERLLVQMVARGVVVAPLVLHAGVSSQEKHEPPQPERFTVPEVTARLVNSTRGVGRRVVAVGTTTVRALETVSGPTGEVHPATGWTDLVLGDGRPARTVDGLLTGLHPPEASHLALLEAVVGADLVTVAYAAVTERGASGRYLWHEFGDTMILLS